MSLEAVPGDEPKVDGLPAPSALYLAGHATGADASAGMATVTVVDVGPAIRRTAGATRGDEPGATHTHARGTDAARAAMAADADADADADAAAVAERLVASFRSTGFAVITGHGVPRDLFDRICAVSAEFFALPLAEKMAVGFPAPEVIRGYEPVPDDSGPARAPNQMESLLINQLEPVGDYPAGSVEARLWRWPNLWPARPAALRAVWEEYYRAMTALGEALLELVALGVGLPRDWFAGHFDRHFNNLAVNHYPPRTDGPAGTETPRNRPHTDHGALTLLYRPSEPGGLEAFADGHWWQVPFLPGSLVINVGDMLERWTGGLLPATPHRVADSAGSAAGGRYSIAYFQQPNPDALIVPALPPTSGRPDYTPVRAGEHISRKELGYHTVAALDAHA
ncbi:2OG-Fe(II) oxygenase [Frankia sp. AiPs1]|uniref:isopenicillin N synthase family dioxygenase n=1 Tax=Frankia sp. AiPa1 TaxID=573492 RepID=UPI00202B4CAC|nr:2OG-Fe(II) oxygenase family protein [Frankia sp. AiPa1]MCL9761409.1 isopenicillin N synthase family oxygenase [Frankia sp. AiPa1]